MSFFPNMSVFGIGLMHSTTPVVPVQLAYYSVEPHNCVQEKPPIIFLHGFTATKEDWSNIPKICADQTKRKVYVLDARNHGDSPWSDFFDFFCIVDDLLNFMDTMNIPKAVLVGHSMGGVTAMRAATKAPERFEKIVAEDIGLKGAPSGVLDLIVSYLELGQHSLSRVPASCDEQTAQKLLAKCVYEAFPAAIQKKMDTKDLESGFILKRENDGSLTFKNNMKILEDAVKKEKQITFQRPSTQFEGPTLFLYGKESPFQINNEEEILREIFPRAELVGIEGAKHGVHYDRPKEFTQALLDFLQKE